MKSPKKNRLIEPQTYKKHIRNRFLEIAAMIKPQAFRQLAGKPFDLLEKARMDQALSPLFEPDFRWNDFEAGAANISSERKDLRDCLIAWQTENYLLETEDSDKWLLRWLVESGVDFWARIVFAEKTSQEKDSNLYFSIKRGLKKGKKFRRKLFKKKEETIVFRRVETSNNLPFLPAYKPPAFLTYDHLQDVHEAKQPLAEYIESAKRDFEKSLLTFQGEMQRYIAENGGFETDNENLLRDLIWTAESQLNGLDYSQLARVNKVEPSDDLEKQKLVNPFEIKEDDLIFDDVQPSTAKRAVEKTLLIIGLEPREKKGGRRRGKRQDEINRQLLI